MQSIGRKTSSIFVMMPDGYQMGITGKKINEKRARAFCKMNQPWAFAPPSVEDRFH
jgi:hypothetical protein